VGWLMGLLRQLALLPLAPVEGVVWLAQQIQSEVDRQTLGPDAVMTELVAWQRALDEGQISEEEYLVAENELLDRLEAVEERVE
jgi:hypothetical protein